MKNTRTFWASIVGICILALAAYIWMHNIRTTAFVSKQGYSISIPAAYTAYEDDNGMIAFPKLVYTTSTQASTTVTVLDYQASYGANTTGLSMTTGKMSGGALLEFYMNMTKALATSTIPLPAGAVEMRTGTITKIPGTESTPAGRFGGVHYAFRTARAYYFFNVFSTNDSDLAALNAEAAKVLASFKETN